MLSPACGQLANRASMNPARTAATLLVGQPVPVARSIRRRLPSARGEFVTRCADDALVRGAQPRVRSTKSEEPAGGACVPGLGAIDEGAVPLVSGLFASIHTRLQDSGRENAA